MQTVTKGALNQICIVRMLRLAEADVGIAATALLERLVDLAQLTIRQRILFGIIVEG